MNPLLRVVLGPALALVGPRLRGLLLSLFSLVFAVGLARASLLAASVPLVLFAPLAFGTVLSSLLLVRLLPRLSVAVFALAVLPLLPLAELGKLGLCAALLAASASLWLAARHPQWLMRVSCASAGAWLCAPLLTAMHPLAARCMGTVGLLLFEELARRFLPEPARAPLATRAVLRIGAALGAVAALAVLSLPHFAAPLGDPVASERPDLPPLPFAARRAALEAAAPHGGLLWPLPSEAITWDQPDIDRDLFPYFDNLDALYLGARTHSLAALPGTSILGRSSLHPQVAEARRTNDSAALARLRAAAEATVASLRDILPLVRPGAPEAQLERALKGAMRAHGCGPESFPLVLASGPSAAQPHGTGNRGVLQEGTLLVADIGCSIDHYASDFTRTLPVSGTFTPRQRLLYENVLAAQNAALAQCKPGAIFLPLNGRGSMEATAREVLAARAPDHDAHMDHGLGHTVGLFVHDVSAGGRLQPGTVITLEPGTYIDGELGIRIEDSFLVGAASCERLTNGFSAEPDAVEAALARRGP